MPHVLRGWSVVPLALLLAGCGDREFDEARSFRHLVAQVEIGPRVPGSPGHARALDYYRAHLEGLADRVFVHEFDAVSPLDSSAVTFRNVVAVFRPDNPTRVLFSAHWDTRPVSD
ncbi:MAG: hypothetical protein ACRDGR_00395, partial [bacterium]